MIGNEAAKKEIAKVKKENIDSEALDKSITHRDIHKQEGSLMSSLVTEDISDITKSPFKNNKSSTA